MDAEAGTRHSETLRTDIRPKNPTPLGVGDVNNTISTKTFGIYYGTPFTDSKTWSYTYEFETNQLSLMSECLEAHGFAVMECS